jgi:Flp pilus assembly protein TadG
MLALVAQLGASRRRPVSAGMRHKRGVGARFADDRSGAVAIPFALMLIVLCGFVGAAVDIGRWLHARQQTLAAMDAAVLAGGRALQLDSTNVSGAIAAAQAFYKENIKQRLPLLSDAITFVADDNNTTFTAQGNAYIDTPLLGLVSIKKLPLLDVSGVDYAKTTLAVGGSSGNVVEISLMLDVTGSMGGSKLDDLKTAATDLIDISLGTQQGLAATRIALIPFNSEVRLPSSANSAARGNPPSTISVSSGGCGGGFGGFGGGGFGGGGFGGGGFGGGGCSQTYKLTPCVVERKGTQKYTDAAPGSGKYVMAKYDTNASCQLSANESLQPLTNDKNALKSTINSMSAKGSTAGQIGTAWAWYTLSPNWNDLWTSADNKAAAYGASNLRKIAILMTDGEYNTEYDTNGVRTSTSGSSAANADSTTQARELCTGMKAKGIEVYTIGFDLGGNQTAIDTLNHCATDSDKSYSAENGEELKEAFRDIALKLNKLYLTQ